MLSLPLIVGMGGLVILLVIAYALLPKKQPAQFMPAPMREPLPEPASRYRSNRDVEIEEDAALVADHFKRARRQEYVNAALASHRNHLTREDQREQTWQAAITRWAAGALDDSGALPGPK